MKILIPVLLSASAFAADGVALAQAQERISQEQRAAEEAAIASRREAPEAEAAARSGVVEAEAAAQRAELQAEAATNRAELEAARARLQQARQELELAAQELARQSAAQYGQLENGFVLDRAFGGSGRPMLGLNISNGADDDGVRVDGVSPNGPAAGAGVQIGDLIVAVDGLDVSGSSDGNSTRLFLDRLGQIEAGSDVTLGVLRDGEPLDLSIVTSDRGFPTWYGELRGQYDRGLRDADVHILQLPGRSGNFSRTRPVFVTGGWNDMELVELTPQLGEYFGTEEGLLVVRAPAGENSDLREGDVILQIGERTPQSVGHAMRILASFEPGESLQLTIMREQRRREIDVAVPSSDRQIVRVVPDAEVVR